MSQSWAALYRSLNERCHRQLEVMTFRCRRNSLILRNRIKGTDIKNRTGLSIYSSFRKLKSTAAILKGPSEMHSGVTETKIKTLTFSTES